ncbi:MAG: class III poly(R)-hydroxyalkanoic acid synthase subunit PhaC [Candidatus Eutrophobiaceae bacterium]
MFPFQGRPDQMIDEIVSFNRQLAHGMDAFKQIGKLRSGISKCEVVWKRDKAQLLRYAPLSETTMPVPVMITYALVNRPYVADLQEGRSIIQGLLKAGLEIYLIDWGYPGMEDRHLQLDDYINGYMDECVKHICQHHGLESINLMGICQGGVFSACYAAMHPERVRNLALTVTPIDFHTKDNLLSHLAKHVDVDLAVDALGNIPGEFLNAAFLSLRPYRLLGQKYVDMVGLLDNPERTFNFLSMEKWIFDSPDQAGEAYRQFIKEFYQQNKLIKDELSIGGREVRLGNIKVPVLNIYASEDHLVPPSSTKALAGKVGSSDYTEIEFPSGHIGIYVSSKAQKIIPRAIVDWLSER